MLKNMFGDAFLGRFQEGFLEGFLEGSIGGPLVGFWETFSGKLMMEAQAKLRTCFGKYFLGGLLAGGSRDGCPGGPGPRTITLCDVHYVRPLE